MQLSTGKNVSIVGPTLITKTLSEYAQSLFMRFQVNSAFVFQFSAWLDLKLKGANFNHSQRSWLVLWEAGVVVELPPWVVAIYPSSLFYHFNVDIAGEQS
jgi:hypothetical protein